MSVLLEQSIPYKWLDTEHEEEEQRLVTTVCKSWTVAFCKFMELPDCSVNSLPTVWVCSYTRITGRNNSGFIFWCLTYLVHRAADRQCPLLPTAFVRLSVTCQRLCQVNSCCFVSTARTDDVMTANQNTAHVICVRYPTDPVFKNITPNS